MPKKTVILLPQIENILSELGSNIRLARLRRNITAKLEAERAGISIATLGKIESGSPAVSIGNYMQVMMNWDVKFKMPDFLFAAELPNEVQNE